MRKTVEEKKELSRRVSELTKIRQNLKDKISQMEKQQEILMKNTDGKKVSELIGYVEKQRNVYRNNIKQLLNKMDPDGRSLGNFWFDFYQYFDNILRICQVASVFDLFEFRGIKYRARESGRKEAEK